MICSFHCVNPCHRGLTKHILNWKQIGTWIKLWLCLGSSGYCMGGVWYVKVKVKLVVRLVRSRAGVFVMFCTSGVTAIFQPRYSTQIQEHYLNESVFACLELNIKSETLPLSKFSTFSNSKEQKHHL